RRLPHPSVRPPARREDAQAREALVGRALRIGIAGATGAIGKELITVLDAAPWRPDTIVPLAGTTSKVPFVAYGEHQVAVDDLNPVDLEGLDALLVALPRPLAGELVQRAAQAGTRVIDLSGSQIEQLDVPLLVPWLGLEALGD